MKFLSLSKNLLIHSILLFLCAMLSTRVMTDDIQHSNNMRIWAAMMWDCCKCRRFWQQLKQVSFPFVRLFIDANNKHAQLKIERDFFCSFFSFLLFSFNHASSGMLLCLLFSPRLSSHRVHLCLLFQNDEKLLTTFDSFMKTTENPQQKNSLEAFATYRHDSRHMTLI